MFNFSSGDLGLNDTGRVCGQSVAVDRQQDPERKDPDRSISRVGWCVKTELYLQTPTHLAVRMLTLPFYHEG